ncbi:MAG: PDDEXK nuclease domain-containing protein [Bacteroidales bacterium]|nr:PDDEXK nuclease domain-containing protein [Bacteroidales bacterium]
MTKPEFIYRDGMSADDNYIQWLSELKKRYRQNQVKAAVRINSAMLEFYWTLGRDIVAMHVESKYGSGFFNQLSLDLKKEFPKDTGFSVTNIKYMKRWYLFYYEEVIIRHQLGDEFSCQVDDKLELPQKFVFVPWKHHVEIFTKSKNINEALFYINKTIENNWSRNTLESKISLGLYKSQGGAVTNFDNTLPQEQSNLAKEILKDPYNFGFLNIAEEHTEKELEEALEKNVTQFLLELGKGFAYVGRQMELRMPSGKAFYPDLIFYHTKLKSYIVVELKAVDFEPEFAGKINFYVSAADELLKESDDNPSIGLIICKSSDKTIVEWSLRGVDRPLGVATYQLKEVVDRTVKEFEMKKKEMKNKN